MVNNWYSLDHCAKSATPARRHITRWIEIGYYISRSLFQFSHAKTDDQKTRGQYPHPFLDNFRQVWTILDKFGQFWSIFEIGSTRQKRWSENMWPKLPTAYVGYNWHLQNVLDNRRYSWTIADNFGQVWIWYFVTKIVPTYCDKKLFKWSRKFLRSLEQFIQTVKGQNNFC